MGTPVDEERPLPRLQIASAAAIGAASNARLTRNVFADNRDPGEDRAGHPTAPSRNY
jgi:hypothetical protein